MCCFSLPSALLSPPLSPAAAPGRGSALWSALQTPAGSQEGAVIDSTLLLLLLLHEVMISDAHTHTHTHRTERFIASTNDFIMKRCTFPLSLNPPCELKLELTSFVSQNAFRRAGTDWARLVGFRGGGISYELMSSGCTAQNLCCQ